MQILVIIGIILFGTGFSTGWSLESYFSKLQYTKQLEKELEKQRKNFLLEQQINKETLLAEQKTQIVTEYVTKEIVKYVPKIQKVPSECSISIDTVRVLNTAISERVPTSTNNIHTGS